MWVLLAAWSPKEFHIPGINDWDEIKEQYLLVSNDESFDQVLSDCVETYDLLKALNEDKAKKITLAVRLFVGQIIALLLVALLPSILPYF